MNSFYLLYTFLVIIIGTYGILTIKTMRRRWRIPSAFAVSSALLLLLFTQGELLSHPKPQSIELWRKVPKAAVLGWMIDDGQAIYLYLKTDQSQEPRSYRYAWDALMAEQLQDTARNMKEGETMEMDTPFRGNPLEDILPFQESWNKPDDNNPFHPAPQPKLPDKMGVPTPPEVNGPKLDL